MGSAEKFCLRWNDFEANISSAFRELREDKDFFDVTLACDDDQISAHKVILSACSPFFRTVLRRNRHEHPLLYLKGVKFVDLVSVLNFMYHGEVNVAQEELNSFLAVAEDLKVKGLTQNGQELKGPPELPKPRLREPPERSDYHQPPPLKRPKPIAQHLPLPPTPKPIMPTYQPDEDDDIQEVMPVKSEPISTGPDPMMPIPDNPMSHVVDNLGYNVIGVQQGVVADPNLDTNTMYGEEDEYADYGNYDGADASMLGGTADGNKDGELERVISGLVSQVSGVSVGVQGMMWQCLACSFVTKKKCNIGDHVEAHHVQGFSHTCDLCGKVSKTRASHRNHKCPYSTKNHLQSM